MKYIYKSLIFRYLLVSCTLFIWLSTVSYAQEAKTGVYAISSPDGISLRISGYPLPSFKDPGFEGYHIFKRLKGEKDFKQITKKMLQRSSNIKDFVNSIGELKVAGYLLVTQSKDEAELWQKFETFDNTLFMYGMFDLDFIYCMGQYYLDTDVKIGQEYEYVMAKVKPNGEFGPASEVFAIKHGEFPKLLEPISTHISIDRKSVKLDWDRNPVDTFSLFFDVYRAENANATFTKLNHSPIITSINTTTGEPNLHSFSDTNVVKRHTYYYKIYSCDLYGNKSLSEKPLQITFADLTPPPQVASLTVTGSRDGLKLVWQKPSFSELAGYYIYRSQDKDTGFVLITPDLVAFNDTTYLDIKIQSQIPYFYRIIAVGTNGYESLPSAVVSGTQSLWVTPDPPVDIEAKPIEKGILISWKPIKDTVGVKGYYVFRTSALTKPLTQISELLNLNQTEYLDTSKTLDPRGTYFYRVKSVSIQGTISAESNAAHAQPIDNTPPEAITGLTGWIDEIGVHLFWDTPQDFTTSGYNIYRKTSDAKSFSLQTESPLSVKSLTYVDTEIEDGKSYTYYITALDAKGNESEKSAPATISSIVSPAKPPNNIRLNNITEGIQILWDESFEQSVEGYNVYRKATGQEWTKVNKALIPLTKPSFIDTQVKVGNIYSYRVVCVKNKNQDGIESDVIFITRSK